jgi:DNA adenine methylase
MNGIVIYDTSHGNNKLIAFGWYGGKFNHLDWLLRLLPQTKHFCEPFGGSAAVLINRKHSPIETYNDIDGEVVNFARAKLLRSFLNQRMQGFAGS